MIVDSLIQKVVRKRKMLLSIPMKVLPRAEEEGRRKMSSVSIATKRGITRRIVGQRVEERQDKGRR
jgi:hypothetical protein